MLGLRPEHLVWAPEDGIEATAQVVEPLGSDTLVFASLAGHEVVCRVPPKTVREPGERLRLRPDLASMHLSIPRRRRRCDRSYVVADNEALTERLPKRCSTNILSARAPAARRSSISSRSDRWGSSSALPRSRANASGSR